MHTTTQPQIVVGIDIHKYSHTAVALDSFGSEIATLTFTNQNLDHCVSWLHKLVSDQTTLSIALENTNSYGIHLAKRLIRDAFRVFYMPPVITDRERKHSTHRIKDDVSDAKRIAKAMLIKNEEALSAHSIVSDRYTVQRTVDLLVQERTDLVTMQTRFKNQLHTLLHYYYGDTYKKEKSNIFSVTAINEYLTDLSKTHGVTEKDADTDADDIRTCTAQSIKRRLKHLRTIQDYICNTDRELTHSTKKEQVIQALTTNLVGCGTLTTCKIIAEIGDITRFTTADKLARYAGIAPIPRSSGRSNRVVTDKYGNRKLNHAIHTIALSQIGRRGLTEGKAYYERKVSEGKSKLWALRCLKRQVIKAVFRIMTNAA